MTTNTYADIDRAEPILARLARRFLRGVPSSDKEDILQSARLALLERILPRLDAARFGPGGIDAYLTTALTRALLDERERRGRAGKFESLDDGAHDAPRSHDDGSNEHHLDALHRRLEETLSHLPDSKQDFMWHLLDLAADRTQLAERLGVKRGSIYQRTARLLEDIQQISPRRM